MSGNSSDPPDDLPPETETNSPAFSHSDLPSTDPESREATPSPRARTPTHHAEVSRAAPDAWHPTIPGYELLKVLGQGGMGIVYRARQFLLNREVALKTIRAGGLASAKEIERFRIEAEVVASLDHPGIVPIYEVGEHQGIFWFSMKLIEGGTLADWHGRTIEAQLIAEGAIQARARLVARVARAVHHAHQHGILHRDLKPGNILLDDQGNPWVADFGLAKRLLADGSLSESGLVVGTPRYMAPEQAMAEKQLSTGADIYSLGAILYELLTGRPPFVAKNSSELFLEIRVREPTAVRRLNPAVERDLNVICLKCLQKEPERRYPSALALAEDLERWLRGEPIHARPVGPVEWLIKWVRRRPAAAALAAALLLLLVMAIGWWIQVKQLAHLQESRDNEHRLANEIQTARAHEQETIAGITRLALLGRSASRPAGWSFAITDEIAQFAGRSLSEPLTKQVRETLAQALMPGDVRPIGHLLQGYRFYNLAISADGRWLAAGENKGVLPKIIVVDLRTGEQRFSFELIGELEQSKSGIRGLAFSPDGRWLAAGTRAGELYVADLSAPQPAMVVHQFHRDSLHGLVFTPDGQRLLSASKDKSIAYWSVGDWQVRTRHTFLAVPDSLVVSPDGKRLACGSRRWLKGFDLASFEDSNPRETWTLQGDYKEVCSSPDGRFLAIAGDGKIHLAVWDEKIVSPFMTFGDPRDEGQVTGDISHLDFNADASLLVCGRDPQHLQIWETASGRLLTSVPLGATGRLTPAFQRRGPQLATTDSDRLRLFTLRDDPIQTFLGLQDRPVEALALSPDGRRLATFAFVNLRTQNRRLGSVRIWDTENGHELLRQDTSGELKDWLGNPGSLSWHPTESIVAVSGHVPSQIGIWDTAQNRLLPPLVARAASSLAFAPDGRSLWAVTDPARVSRWDWPAREGSHWFNFLSDQFRGQAGMQSVAVGRHWAVAGSDDSFTRLFPTGEDGGPGHTWRPSRVLPEGVQAHEVGILEVIEPGEESDPVQCVALSGDETLAASGTRSGMVHVARVSDGATFFQTKAHTQCLEALAFSPDGRMLASASRDEGIRLWARTEIGFQEFITLPKLPRSIVGLTFSPDGQRLFFAHQGDRAVRVFHLDRLNEQMAKYQLAR